jgi:VIT1/CCC1 family predicted Fe2+/Mn2+ transporter
VGRYGAVLETDILHEHQRRENAAIGGVGRHLRDLILGGQDGLVNVLGLVLGLTAASADSRIIIVGGMAALLAESIAMAGVMYTSANAERDYYYSEVARERREMVEMPDAERAEVRKIFWDRGVRGDLLDSIVTHFTSDQELWLKIMMRDELNLPEPSGGSFWRAVMVGLSCAVGSAVPLVPYFFLAPSAAAVTAIVFCAAVLFGVGWYKAVTLVGTWWKSGLQMLAIGLLSAFAGYLIGLVLRAPPEL